MALGMTQTKARRDRSAWVNLDRINLAWLSRGGAMLAIALLGLCLGVPSVAAQEEEQFPPNPLEITEPDPLLPTLVVDRPLSPQERSVLAAALDELQAEAEATFAAGDITGALEIWNRELRLRRVLGVEQEVASLSRVGEVAWRENQTTEVRIITQRLQEIQQEVQAQSPTNFELLLSIAKAHQNMRAIDSALAAYEQILAQARLQQDRTAEKNTLLAMGELHLAWFDYVNAAATYQELLALAEADGDALKQEEYLGQLAYIYQQDNQPEQAIAVQQRLVEVYQRRQEFAEIPPLKLAIADAYVTLGRPDLAAPSYQEAFATARSTQQYAYASDALQRLANLYQSLDRIDDALTVYQLLIDVEQQSYNTYGMMETYDQIGQLHRAQGNTNQAIAAFRRGLELAQQLNYRVSYFTDQIQQISQQGGAGG
jgi:tetratricopeptide (TPR) repeat protein